MAYALICLIFGLVTFPAGRLSDKLGPRNVVLIGGLVMAFGFFMVSTITPPDPEVVKKGGEALQAANRTPLYLLYLYYGVICGLGGGCVYLPPIATAPKWWPDRRALATGFTVVGLGLGSFIMAPLATGLINHYGSALPVFKIVGIAMGIMVVMAALCLKVPPAGYKPAGWNPPAAATGAGAPKVTRDYTYEETKGTAQFWLLWVAYFCGSFAGLMVIGLIAKHGIDAMSIAYKAKEGLDMAAKIPADAAKTISMAAAGAPSALAITNALVRIMIGPSGRQNRHQEDLHHPVHYSGRRHAGTLSGRRHRYLAGPVCRSHRLELRCDVHPVPCHPAELLRSDRAGFQLWSAVHRLGCCRFLRPLPRW